jgi:antirestriction factor ArdC-like protein
LFFLAADRAAKKGKKSKPPKERKEMNSEQIAEQTSKAIEELAAALAAGHSEELTAYLRAIGRFHKYSLHNVLLITLQKPDARHIAGFHAWHTFGRHVRKGERGITIFAPILRRQRVSQNGTEENQEEAVIGYRPCTVFDVSQTEGKELPSIGKVRGDAHHYEERLSAFTLSLGIRLEYSESILPARGISEGGKITLLPGMPSAEHAAVLAHELAHEFLHHQPRRAATTKTLRETEAEAVAYVVCHSIGLETGSAAADYIQLHRGDAKLLLESLGYIRLAAGRILDGILGDESLPEVRAA